MNMDREMAIFASDMPRHLKSLAIVIALLTPPLVTPALARWRRQKPPKIRLGGSYHNDYVLGNLSGMTTDLFFRKQLINWQETTPITRVQLGIQTLFGDPDWRKRKAAIGDLLWHPSARVEEALVRALRDPTLAVREMAVRGLGKIGTNRSLLPLMDAMKYSPGPIRDSIAESLRQLTGENYGRHLDRWRRWRTANRGALR
jgi:hypothetical protein